MDLVEICKQAQQEMFAHGDAAAVDIYTTEDVVSHTSPPGGPQGRAGIMGVIGFIHAAFDDVRYEIEDAFGSGDRVVLRTRMSGTHARPFMGHQPTGRSFSTEQIHIFRMADGRIAEHWACRDDVGMMRQLGLINAPTSAPAGAPS